MMRFCTLIVIAGLLALAAPAFADDPACDYDGKNGCDEVDKAAILGAMGTQEGDAGFVAFFDYDGDGVISPADLSYFVQLSR